MLRFVIGLGINSVPGAAIERALLKNYVPDDFEIIPIRESVYKLGSLLEIQKRAVAAAEAARRAAPADAYFGVTSGQCLFMESNEPGALRAPARADIVAGIVGDTYLDPEHLDPADIRWQLHNRVYALASRTTAVAELALYVRKHCGYKALPPPKK